MNFYYISALCIIGYFQATEGVSWNGNNWAMSCDFPGNDLRGVTAKGEQCGSTCGSTSGCTHWSFTDYNGGTCWLKTGSVSKGKAQHSDDQSASCGLNGEGGGNDDEDKDDGGDTGTLPPSSGSALAAFTKCQFNYGRDYVGDNTDYSQYDYMTIWLGTIANGCHMKPECTNFNIYHQGSMLRKAKAMNKIPVFYAYVIAFEAKNDWGLQDCDVGTPSLCQKGVKYIRDKKSHILNRYDQHTKSIADIYGRDGMVVFLVEPDFWQFYGDHTQEGGNMSGQEMRSLFDDIVGRIKKNLPKAIISFDISAWIGENGFRTWWGFFKSSKDIDFINTSGGRMNGDTSELKPGELRWKFLSETTGKKIIADCGYGIAGNGYNNREPWYQNNNVNNRVGDGVIAVSIAGATKNPYYKKKVC